MTEKDIENWAESVYALGFKNGQIEMKNKILKNINRNWNLVTTKRPMSVATEILKKIYKIPLSKKSPSTSDGDEAQGARRGDA